MVTGKRIKEGWGWTVLLHVLRESPLPRKNILAAIQNWKSQAWHRIQTQPARTECCHSTACANTPALRRRDLEAQMPELTQGSVFSDDPILICWLSQGTKKSLTWLPVLTFFHFPGSWLPLMHDCQQNINSLPHTLGLIMLLITGRERFLGRGRWTQVTQQVGSGSRQNMLVVACPAEWTEFSLALSLSAWEEATTSVF